MTIKRFLLIILLVWAVLPGGWFLTGPVFAANNDSIHSIRVEGSKRIEPETVRSYLRLGVGDPFDPAKIRESISALFETGLFKDVSLGREGGALVVQVVENPMVNEVTFEGNDAFSAEELEKITTLKPYAIYEQAKTERDLTALRQAFRIKGLFLAKIDVETKPIENNQVNLIYKIQEGKKSKVREVRIIGNHGLKDKELTKKLLIQPSDWLSWYTETDTYDREKLLFDQAQLRNVYLDKGYVRISVGSSVAELTPDRSAFLVTHTVHEGDRYRFGPIKIVGDFDELPSSDMYQVLTIAKDQWYSQQKLRQSIEQLTNLIGDFGYAFLDIKPEQAINDDSKTVDLVLRVSKGKRVYVNRIEISGNTRTQDNVIRREVTLVEGDRFSASRLRDTKKQLNRLNFFENVQISVPPANNLELVDVKINVEEKPTGTFTLGGGYSSQDAFLGTASISQNNFLGKGQRMIFSFSYSGRRTEYNISFTEPYFMGKKLSVGFDLFNRDFDQTNLSSIKERTYGGALRLGFPLSSHLHNTISYRFSNTEIDYTGAGTPSPIIQQQEALSPYLQSMISNTLSWDDVDNRLLPSDGRIHRLTIDYSGLGGDVRFGRALTDNHLYYPLDSEGSWVGHLRGRFGVEDGLGEDIPIFERFFLGGGSNMRGFMSAGIGPRTTNGDAYGGVHFEQINTELLFPILGMEEKGIRGLAYLDAGYLGDWNLPNEAINSKKVRVATGVGLHWNSPFGPLRFTLSTPLVKEEYDNTRVFDFSIGSTL